MKLFNANKTEEKIKDAVLVSKEEQKEADKKEEVKENSQSKSHECKEDAFSTLAQMLGKSEKEIKEECILYQAKKIMASLGKVIVRYAPEKSEFAKVFYNCSALGINELMLSPAYLSEAKRLVKNENYPIQQLSAIVDFPFGEGMFKRKITEVKDLLANKLGNVYVMMPTSLVDGEQIKVLKKQTLKFAKLNKAKIGVAFSASDMSEEQLKNAIKTAEKTPVSTIVLVFGEVSEEEVKNIVQTAIKYKGNKKLKVLCNVKDEQAIISLVKMGVCSVLSPFADETGSNIIKRLNIESIKLK